MIGIKRKRVTELETRVAILQAEGDRLRRQLVEDRDRRLSEYDILRSIPEDERSPEQCARLQQLTGSLWPPPERNPMNGVRTVPGGHGYRIPAYGP